MTAAKPHHLTARKLLLQHLDLHPGKTVAADLDPAEVGIVGDTAHQAGGDSYHLGKDQIRARGDRARYSVDESPRDQAGLDNYASALDIGYFKVTTARGTFDLYTLNAWLVALCRAGDPDTTDLREVIYSLDGKTVHRWDRLGRRSSGDNTHTWHTHLSEHRDASGQRMTRLASRWLQHIGLVPGEEDMIVRKGDTGEQVKFWQYVMADLGFPTGAGDAAYDGQFGPKMEAAVNAYRRAQGVNTTTTLITGWTGWHMLRALSAKHAGKPGPAGPAGVQGPAGVRGPAGPAGPAGVLTGALTVTGGQLAVETRP